MHNELKHGIASYLRTWSRFDGLRCSAQCGTRSDQRHVGIFMAGECQPTITASDGRRFLVRDLGSLRVEDENSVAASATVGGVRYTASLDRNSGVVVICDDDAHTLGDGWWDGDGSCIDCAANLGADVYRALNAALLAALGE